MIIKEESVKLSDGRELTLRSPSPDDAEALLDYLRQTAEETHFLNRLPGEDLPDIFAEQRFINQLQDAENAVMVTLFDGSRAVGSSSVLPAAPFKKEAHRAGFAVAILKDYQSLGLGHMLTQHCIDEAVEFGYEQLELDVYEDNTTAKALYESFGFSVCGRLPNAFKLPDGSYRDQITMVKDLRPLQNRPIRLYQKGEHE